MSPRMSHGTNSSNYVTGASPPDLSLALRTGFGRLINTFTLDFPYDGSTLSLQTIPHGLNYAPFVIGAINQTVNTAIPFNLVSVILPTFLSANIGGSVSGVVSFNAYLYLLVDETNIYAQLLNATGDSGTITVTYYIYQQPVEVGS